MKSYSVLYNALSVLSFNLHPLLQTASSTIYLLSFSWCPLSLRFPLSHPVSVIYPPPSTLTPFHTPSRPPSPPVPSLYPETALRATHSFGRLSTDGGCIDSPISLVSTWQEEIPLISPLPEGAAAHSEELPPILHIPPPNLRSSPRHLLKSSPACLSASSAFKIQ